MPPAPRARARTRAPWKFHQLGALRCRRPLLPCRRLGRTTHHDSRFPRSRRTEGGVEPHLQLPFALCAGLVKGEGEKARPPTHRREGLLRRLFSPRRRRAWRRCTLVAAGAALGGRSRKSSINAKRQRWGQTANTPYTPPPSAKWRACFRYIVHVPPLSRAWSRASLDFLRTFSG